MNTTPPRILPGTRDFLPQEMMQRDAVLETVRKIVEGFGYAPIETPILCPAETILDKYGEAGNRLAYSFSDGNGNTLALPCDLTVPFARFFATHHQKLPLPFKRYQIQRVWRAETSAENNLREFYQCDIDIIGSKSLLCEAEIIKIIAVLVKKLGISDLTINISSGRLIHAIADEHNLRPGAMASLLHLMKDKARTDRDAVVAEWKKTGIHHAEETIDRLTPGKTNRETLAKLAPYHVPDLENVLKHCQHLGIPEKNLRIDPRTTRGLEYYTGLLFEAVSKRAAAPICTGGRYDDLCGLFSKTDFSGVGVAFNLEQTMKLLAQNGSFEHLRAPSRVLVTVVEEEAVEEALQTYAGLIAAGIPTEMYFGPEEPATQFRYAEKKQIPFAVVQGPEEKEKQEIIVRRIGSGKEKNIPANQLISYISNYYEAS